ncbi:unnamed protein product [Penicillium manginii]
MKFLSLLGASLLAGHVSAFHGQLAASGYIENPNSPGFEETSPGGYGFGALVWRTSDGCHNIDFQGALNSGHGYCCGSLPCDITA